MNSHTHRTFSEDGGTNPEQRLDQLLAHHHTHLITAITSALDTGAGATALTPLRRELFRGLKPFKITPHPGCIADNNTTDPAPPPPTLRLQGVLTQLRDLRLLTQTIRAATPTPSDTHTRTHATLTALQHLHTGLQTRSLTHDQVRALFRELREHTAHISTAMLKQPTALPRHTAEEWLRATGSLARTERTVLRLLRDAADNAPAQN